MKLIEKIAEAMGVFSPIIILLFASVSYLHYPVEENPYPGEVKKEIKQKQAEESDENYNLLHPFLLFRL